MIDHDFDPSQMLDAFDEVSPIRSAPPGGRELRRGTRYNVSWRVIITVEGDEPRDGKISDISVQGAAILIGRNLKPNTRIALNICIPSMANGGAPRIIKVQGKSSYTVHDQKHQCFRVGMTFIEFGLASDRSYLEARLSNHHIEVL